MEKVSAYFKFKERETDFTTEIRAGLVTFFTLAYILVANPAILADTGGPCYEKYSDTDEQNECISALKKDLIVATAASSCVATLLIGLWANLPLGLAPGMGTNAYFAYSVVGAGGSGNVKYNTALTCIFLEGIIFCVLALTGMRLYLAKMIPSYVKTSTTIGIGLFIALLGLGPAEGIGLIASDTHTYMTLAGCGHKDQSASDSFACSREVYGSEDINGFMPDDAFCGCEYYGHKMEGATTWIGILGFLLIIVLSLRKVKAAVLISIMVITSLSWFRGLEDAPNAISYFPYTSDGNSRYEYFKKVFDFHTIEHTLFALELEMKDLGAFFLALFTFLYVDVLDTTGTLYSMTHFAGMIDEDGNFEGSTAAFTSDALGTVVGALAGTSPVTTYIESGAGIKEGGKTGFTACVIAFLFFLSLFFAPILASIPPWAYGPALIYVGCVMLKESVSKIDWSNERHAIPAAMTIMMMPFTYSIAYGIISGLFFSLVIYLVDLLTGVRKWGDNLKKETVDVNVNTEIQRVGL